MQFELNNNNEDESEALRPRPPIQLQPLNAQQLLQELDDQHQPEQIADEENDGKSLLL